jgi:micrococcal nuclease
MRDGKAEKIRLHGIDAPERGQAFSNRAKQFVSELCFGKEITVKPRGPLQENSRERDVA